MNGPTRATILVSLLASLLGTAACAPGGTGGADAGEEPTLDEEACEHMQDGPANAVTAAVDESAEIPDVTEGHTRHDVSLVAVEGGNGGLVRFESAEAGDAVIFLSADVPLEIEDPAGAVVAIEASAPVETCAEVAVEKIVELGIGRHLLRFGPTDETAVSLVIEAGAEHEHEE